MKDVKNIHVEQEEKPIENSPYIFLAEDDIDDQELLIEAMIHHADNVKIEIANNGRKAILFLENLPDHSLPCLIILDYNLPELDGAQILKALSTHIRYSNVPKVVWSTSNSHMYRQVCLDEGANAYFVKPSDIVGIKKLAKEMLSICDIK
jgi:CheY-like chemotaxis protein